MKKLFLLLIVAIVFSYAIAVPAAAAERAVFEKTWGTYGTGDGQFNHPGGIVVDASGNVYVADGWNKRIQKFTSDGIFLTKWGSNGSGDGQFTSPYGLAVDAAGNIFVADASTNERIQKFTSDGAFLAKWGKPGQVGSVKEEPGDVS